MDKPEALRLADELDGIPLADMTEALADDAAAELRRLHAEHTEDQTVIAVWRGRTLRAEQQRDELLEALKAIAAMTDEDTGTFRKRGGTYRGLVGEIARAAIAKAEGEPK